MSEFTEGPAYSETCGYCAHSAHSAKNPHGATRWCFNVGCIRFLLFGPRRVSFNDTCKKFELHYRYKSLTRLINQGKHK